MSELKWCAIYLAGVGIVSFVLGRIVPKHWFRAEAFPFRCFDFEREGRIYEKLWIRKWQSKVLDMSRIVPFLMPKKRLIQGFEDKLPRMIQETCVAECVHELLSIAGLMCLRIWSGPGGIVVTVLYIILGNVPYIIVQRYNRPRLVRMQKKLIERQKAKRIRISEWRREWLHENSDIKLQYRGRS